MGKIDEAIHGIHYLDAVSSQDKWINRIHPLAKLSVTVVYILLLLSFGKYGLTGTLGMGIYLIVLFTAGEVSVKRCFRLMLPVLLIVCAVGIANPILDRSPAVQIGELAITGGMLSMAVLVLKGIFSVFAAYLLIVSTSMERIGYALRLLRMPKSFVTVLLLIYRYIIVLLKEAERIILAYKMRAPGQKGIHIKAWGSLLGQLLIRSIDRSQLVYDSMVLRGFAGEFPQGEQKFYRTGSIIYTGIWMAAFILWGWYSLAG